jgi:hypothetical protein
MSAQPEALRLADLIRSRHGNDLNDEAAAELRRLNAECNDLAHQLNRNNERNGRIIAQRDALLEALQSIADCCDEEHAARDYASRQTEIRGIARAAIKAVEEQK